MKDKPNPFDEATLKMMREIMSMGTVDVEKLAEKLVDLTERLEQAEALMRHIHSKIPE